MLATGNPGNLVANENNSAQTSALDALFSNAIPQTLA
jgi:hypothetical protein